MISSKGFFGFLLLVVLLLNENTQVSGFFGKLFNAGGGNQAGGERDASVGFEGGVLMSKLANDKKIPLVGLGVGHSPNKYVGALVSEAVQDNRRIRLVDTASNSENEHLIAEGILAGAEKLGRNEKLEVHVVTKVWYTHLGYQRTKMSIEKSLQALAPAMKSNKVDLKIHLMLNWPRCYDRISATTCAQEEAALDAATKQAGPDPTQDPNAWKESWKYMEEIYLSGEYPIESIGLSNFQLEDIEQMDSFARIGPHVIQVSLWSLLYDSHLVEFCHKHRIMVQVYNALEGTVSKPGRAPHAYHHIEKVAYELSQQTGLTVTPAQTVMAWLVQHGISVIPRTSKLSRLEENSGVILSTIPTLTDNQVHTVAHAAEAFVSGHDLEKDLHVAVTFHAVADDLMLYWMLDDGTEMRIDHIWKGQTYNETTYPNHVYRTYNAHNKDIYAEFTIDANFGEHKHIYVDSFDHEDSIQHQGGIPQRVNVATDPK